jgi:hypothetical protein
LEPLRLLRWILRIDYFLPVIGRAPDLSYTIAHEIVVSPERALGAQKIIDRESLATASRAAEEYFYRCGAESISRGYSETNHEPVKIWADDVSGSLAGKQGEDLLLGTRLVSEASPEELSRVLMLARTRMNFLAWTEALLSESAVPELPFSFPAEPQSVSYPPGSRS